ncbi:MAG: hypothetical protein GWO11_08315 [Desulfuromonadales bacterium]|nr:hypothetical protein [Desulfuromonadales bacterium]NIS44284.1 hypothetical protein [Desulfuromonadales bacterium]
MASAQPAEGDTPHLGSHATSNKDAFRGVVTERCIVCHERPMVEEAVRTERLGAMKQHLVEQGVPLSEGEKQVLGTFWGEPMRQKQKPDVEGPTVTEADYHQFRQILQSRCTGCHTLERVERAMAGQRSYEAVIQEMVQRGAVLSEREKTILRRFWGRDTPGRR